MAAPTYPYRPDYAVSPGQVLAEHLTARDIKPVELAERCQCSLALVNDILAGKAVLENGLAHRLEEVLGMDARIWVGIEAEYRAHRCREAGAK